MSTAGLNVRRAAPADRPVLEALWAAFMVEQAALDPRVTPSPDAIQRARATLADLIRGDGGTLFVADRAGEVVAFLAAEWYTDAPVYAFVPEVHLLELYVTPEVRKQGVARALLDEAEAWARDAGAKRLRMSVLWQNEASRRLVEQWGVEPLAVSFTRDL